MGWFVEEGLGGRTCLPFWTSAWYSYWGVRRRGRTGRRVADEYVRKAGFGGNILYNEKSNGF